MVPAVSGLLRCARMKARVNGWFEGGSSGDAVSIQCNPIRGTVIPAGVVLSRTWVDA